MGGIPGIQFNGDKSYVIDISALGLTLNLTGIVNNSSVSQTIRSSTGLGNLSDKLVGNDDQYEHCDDGY